jgi:hypothetical protein
VSVESSLLLIERAAAGAVLEILLEDIADEICCLPHFAHQLARRSRDLRYLLRPDDHQKNHHDQQDFGERNIQHCSRLRGARFFTLSI